MYIPAHASWNYPQEWHSNSSEYLKPSEKKIYDKPVVILTNAETFSSSEDFCVKFKGMLRGKIIGTPTGGSTGNGVQVLLIEDIATANICSKKVIAPDGTIFVGFGVIPVVGIKDTKQSYIDNKDITLGIAISEIVKY